MACRNRKPSQLSLFEPTIRWSDLPVATREKVIDQVAQLLLQVNKSVREPATSASAMRQGTIGSQESGEKQ
jgi:hypothetical protein